MAAFCDGGLSVGRRLAIVVAVLFMAGCRVAEDRRAFTSDNRRARTSEHRLAFTRADSWYSPPPSVRGLRPLDEDRFAPVTPALQAEAQAGLADVSAKRVTAKEAARWVGRPLAAGGVYVLLRAVVLFEGTGKFYVGVCGRAVHVHHGCLGGRPAPMGRRALVAVLPAVPETVYVSCGMVE